MKKINFLILAVCLSLAFRPQQSSAAIVITPSAQLAPQTDDAAQAQLLEQRLTEISAMDMSGLKASEA